MKNKQKSFFMGKKSKDKIDMRKQQDEMSGMEINENGEQKTGKKLFKIIWSLCSICCLAAAFFGTYQYMKARQMLAKKTVDDRKETVMEGTYCTLKSNSLDGVPIYKKAGDTAQFGLLPEGKCCQILKMTQVDGKKWMQVSYCGMTGWLKKKRLHFISDDIRYITAGDIVYMNALSEKGIKGYKEPSASSDIVESNIVYGAEYTVKELKNGWGKVESHGKTFWINMYHMGSYLPKKWKVETLSSAREINLRAEPEENEKSLGKVPENTRLEIIKYQNGWGKIEYEGLTGWVMLHYLTPIKE